MGFRIAAAVSAFALTTGWVSMAAPAREVTVACSTAPALPAHLSDWTRTVRGKTFYGYGEARAEDWPPLGAARTSLALHRFESLRYAVGPARAANPFRFGGMVPVVVDRPGRLVIALSEAAWIDVVRDGSFVTSVAHGHGPACSGIRKMIEFDVTPGRYLLQISGASSASIDAMAVLRN